MGVLHFFHALFASLYPSNLRNAAEWKGATREETTPGKNPDEDENAGKDGADQSWSPARSAGVRVKQEPIQTTDRSLTRESYQRQETYSDPKKEEFPSSTNVQSVLTAAGGGKRKSMYEELLELENKRRKTICPAHLFVGLANIGNSCYLNSVIQALKSLNNFMSDLAAFKFDSCDSMPSDCVFRKFFELMKTLHCSKIGEVIDPSDLKLSVSKYSSKFQGLFEEDAHELLCDLLNQIQENAIIFNNAFFYNGTTQKLQFKDLDCPVTKNFSCFIENNFKCLSCGHATRKNERYQNISLNFPETFLSPSAQNQVAPISIQSCLENYFQNEKIEWRCDNCGNNTCFLSKKINRLPRVLVLHLKRFFLKENFECEKRLDRVRIAKFIDIGSFCSQTTSNPLTFGLNQDTNLPDMFSSNQSYYSSSSVSTSARATLSSVSTEPSTLVNPIKRHKDVNGQRVAAITSTAKGTRIDDQSFESDSVQAHKELDIGDKGSNDLGLTSFSDYFDIHMSDGNDDIRESAEDLDLQRAISESIKESLVQNEQLGLTGSKRKRGKDENSTIEVTEIEKKSIPVDDSCSLPTRSSIPSPISNSSNLYPVPVFEIIDNKDEDLGVKRYKSRVHESKSKIPFTKYKLQSVINHSGYSAASGHFFTDVYHSPSGQWFRYNDCVVSEVPESLVFNPETEAQNFLLFYVLEGSH